jgi:hypothetical protein
VFVVVKNRPIRMGFATMREKGDYPSPLTLTVLFNFFLSTTFDLQLGSKTVSAQNGADLN